MGRIPISVVTGFLGSGKTTLLRHLLSHPDMARTAVVVNEFGAVGLDHALVEASREDTVLLSSGCLCCTVRGDLIKTLGDLFLRRARGEVPRFGRVIVETTGLADPAPILHTLIADPLAAGQFRLDGVIATVDAASGADTLDRHWESVKQAAVADRIVLTKTDLVPPHRVAALTARLRGLNPAAPILVAAGGAIDPAALLDAGLYDPATKRPDVLNWLRAEAYAAGHHPDHHEADDHGAHGGHHHHHDVNRHGDDIRAFCVARAQPIPAAVFNWFAELLTANRGPDLLRIKGILNIAEHPDTPAVIHGVQHVFHPVLWLDGWPSADRRSRIVLITRGIGRHQVADLLDALQRHVEDAGAAGG